jgi:hypothetical protein
VINLGSSTAGLGGFVVLWGGYTGLVAPAERKFGVAVGNNFTPDLPVARGDNLRTPRTETGRQHGDRNEHRPRKWQAHKVFETMNA